MKKISLISLLFSVLFVGCTGLNKTKVAYFNSIELLALIPESKTIDSNLQIYSNQLNMTLSVKQQDLQKKINQFVKDSNSLATDIREFKKKELITESNEVQKLQETSNKQLLSKRTELTKDLFKRINDAVEQIAIENGYDFVFDSATTPFIYKDKKKDILSNLKIKLRLN